MNRNAESKFALAPTMLDMPRSTFDRSHSVKFTGNVGDVIPFYWDQLYPGDTFQGTTSKVVRFQTMLKPIMDSLDLDIYYFAVPNRLLWNHWKNFCGESEKAWDPEVTYTIPQLAVPVDGFEVGSLADYLGVPPELKNPNHNVTINALPFRAYALIMNEFFRSEALTDPCVIEFGDATVAGNTKSEDDIYCAKGGPLFKACRYHDYFSSCLPAPQALSGAMVHFKEDRAPVMTEPKSHSPFNFADDPWPVHTNFVFGTDNTQYRLLYDRIGTGGKVYPLEAGEPSTGGFMPTNLYADLSAGIAVNTLRQAFAVQKFLEASARSGRRYVEIIRGMFSVVSPDARMQRPEYLGGNRVPIGVSSVTNNSESPTTPLGNLGATSLTTDIHDDFIYSASEHCILMGLAVVRYKNSYAQGLDREFMHDDIYSYYWPQFANIGETPVYRYEIYAGDNSGMTDQVFGYQEAWADLRYKNDRVCADFRPSAPNNLASWHLSDDYESAPYLSDEWIRSDKTNVDRVLAVTSHISNQFFADFYIKMTATRPLPMYSIPGLVDHH